MLRLVAFVALAATGCAKNPAPRAWLPHANAVPSDVYGAWVQITPPKDRGVRVAGELLAIDHDSVYVLGLDGRVTATAATDALPATIAFYNAQIANVALLTTLGALSTISNGMLLLLTFPSWVIAGTASAAADSRAPLRRVRTPGDWPAMHLFARFPAGLPANLPRSGLSSRESPRASSR